MPTVFREVKRLENFRSGLESHNAVLLANCQRGNPNRDERRYEERISRVADESAQNKAPGVERKLLLAVRSLFANKTDRVELLQLVPG
jgi:hypothetical protein